MLRWRANGAAQDAQDELALEEPLEIRVRGRGIAITMRTPGPPGSDDELAAGFLVTEAVVKHRRDIARIDPCVRAADGNIINVFLAPHVELDEQRLTRHVFASSSCGLCGKASIDAVQAHFPPVDSTVKVTAKVLQSLPGKLRNAQATFDRTGGLHAAAVFTPRGRPLVLREDVGRHNAVDKAIGHCLLHGPWPLDEHLLLVSGRASFEITQKALAARVPIVAAVSAPSSLAAQFAQESGQTLVGFLREGRMNIYTHAQRVVLPKR